MQSIFLKVKSEARKENKLNWWEGMSGPADDEYWEAYFMEI